MKARGLIQTYRSLVMFTQIFDGLRSYYAGYPSRRADCGFHAAATMSFIFSAALTGAVVLGDYLINGSIDRSVSLLGHKAALLLAGVIIGCAHVYFAKRTGRYHSTAPFPAPHWKAYLWTYVCAATTLVLGAILLAIQSRR